MEMEELDSDDVYVLIVEESGEPVMEKEYNSANVDMMQPGEDVRKLLLGNNINEVKIEPLEVKLEQEDIKVEPLNDLDSIIMDYVQAMDAQQKTSPTITRKPYGCSDDQYRCFYCKHTSSTENNASRHYQSRHGQRHYKCLACNAGYRRHDTMIFHESYCQAENAHLVRLAREVYTGRKTRPKMSKKERRAFKIPCKICGKIISLANMKTHLFVHSDEKRYACPHCSARFRTKRSQNAHINAHTGVRPYQCNECSNAYTSDTALRAHKLDHGERTYHCHYCERSYKRKHTLKEHLITHADGNEYLCNECGKVLYNQMAMEQHTKAHRAALAKFTCSDCGKKYSKMTSLNFHMKNKHGREIITRKMFFNKLPTLTDVESSLLLNVNAIEEQNVDNPDPIYDTIHDKLTDAS